MPSIFGTIRPRLNDRTSIGSARSPQEVYEEVIRGPWPGYVPDLEDEMVPYAAMTGSSFGLISRGEILVPDVGWVRVDAARLPLGDDGAGVGAVPATRAQRVQHLGYFNRQPTTDNDIPVSIPQRSHRINRRIKPMKSFSNVISQIRL